MPMGRLLRCSHNGQCAGFPSRRRGFDSRTPLDGASAGVLPFDCFHARPPVLPSSRRRSSAGQSSRLVSGRSGVRIPAAAPRPVGATG